MQLLPYVVWLVHIRTRIRYYRWTVCSVILGDLQQHHAQNKRRQCKCSRNAQPFLVLNSTIKSNCFCLQGNSYGASLKLLDKPELRQGYYVLLSGYRGLFLLGAPGVQLAQVGNDLLIFSMTQTKRLSDIDSIIGFSALKTHQRLRKLFSIISYTTLKLCHPETPFPFPFPSLVLVMTVAEAFPFFYRTTVQFI